MKLFYDAARAGQRVLVTMPDGYRVWPDEQYDKFEDASLFALVVDGIGENGERVTLSGKCISRVSPARVMPRWID